MAYAVNTSVSIAKTKADIEELIQKAGASQFVSGNRDNLAVIGFSLSDRQIRFVLPLPEKNSPEFQLTPGRKQKRSEEQAYAAWEQSCRSRWRSLFLVIKAKLEAVDSGISTIEREFFYDIVLQNGKTVGELMAPQIEDAYTTGKMPALLPMLDS